MHIAVKGELLQSMQKCKRSLFVRVLRERRRTSVNVALRGELTSLLHMESADELRRQVRNGILSNLTPEEKGAFPRETARLGRLDMLRVLCEQSHVIAMECDEDGRDLLHYATMSGNAELIVYVIDVLGFDPLRGDKLGVTALDIAHQMNHTDALAVLEQRAGFSLADAYRNPVRRGFYPDPSVMRVGEDYYLVNSTFVQFPCLPISHSKDLVHWHTIGHAVDTLAWSGIEGLPGGHGYWAPDISYYKGRFWVVATLRRDTEPFRLQMITSSERPEGPYDEPHFLDINGIDPSIFTDDDGRRYVVVNPGAQIVEIDDEGYMIGQPRMVYYGSVRVKTEGPHLLKKDGWYYLFQAEGGTGSGHMETVARSRDLYGPYQPCPHNPILGRKEMEAPIRRSGHGKPLMLPDGRWYMTYLCGRDVDGKTMLGRETALDPMTWTADGWPMVNDLKGPSCLQQMPLPAHPWQDEPIREEDFVSPRSDWRAFAKVTEDGWALTAGSDPNTVGPVSLLLRRQWEKSFLQSAAVDVSVMTQGMAGLCGYYDENSFYLFGLNTQGEIVLEEQIGTERKCTVLKENAGAKAMLSIAASGARRELCLDGECLCVIDAAYLSDEGLRMGKRFTGATLGMAAVGSGEAVFTCYEETMKDDRHV